MLQVTRYEDPHAYARAVSALLARREAENNLPIGILANVLAGEYRDPPPYLALVSEDGAPLVALIRTPPHRLLVSYLDAPPSAQLVEQCVEHVLEADGREVPGVTADKKVARPIALALARATGRDARLSSAMGIYALSEVTDARRASGELRRLRPEEDDLACEWLLAFGEESGFDPSSEERARARLATCHGADEEQRGLLLWHANGSPVSMVGYTGPTPNGIRVGPVYTPPEHRGHGYASAAVAELSRRLLAGGRRSCFLFTDLANPTSNHIYKEVGYRRVSDVDSWDLE